ncbi:MAG: DUF4153 domain-containing protein [Caulobacterales bacterium]|nr:DUF4153 domain-containing protein [Caulobacterales bacterium]
MAYGVEERAISPVIGWTRIATGLAQGVLLWALTEAADNKVWPATSGPLFGVLAAVVLFTPFVVLAGIAEMRRRNVAIWAVAVAVVMALLGLHDVTRRAAADIVEWLTPEMMVFTAAGLFIGHHLLEAGDLDDRLIARYPTYFDLAWKHGVQLAMSVGFVGVFWLVLTLGGALFKLIGIEFVEELLRKTWFAIPATTTMFAAAVQLTDVRHALIRGVRTVALTLLSWLLPVLVFLAAAFMASLPFTGLEVLWNTKSAAAILLSASAVMVILINAAYQDGVPDSPTPLVLRWAGRIGGLLMIPLVGVAAYALCLRIGQYGLTPDRIIAAACVVAGACYAVGYGVAAVLPGLWMKALEVTNVVTAFVVLGLLLALFSPLADPARLSVNDQMARIAAGKVAADKIDYRFLRFDGEKYGRAALEGLVKKGGDTGKRASVALKWTNKWSDPGNYASQTDFQMEVRPFPAGTALPAGFLTQKWELQGEFGLPCRKGENGCNAYLADLTGDGVQEVLVQPSLEAALLVYWRGADGKWRQIARTETLDCGKQRLDALDAGRFTVVPPRLNDLQVEDHRFEFEPLVRGCMTTPPRKSRIRPVTY